MGERLSNERVKEIADTNGWFDAPTTDPVATTFSPQPLVRFQSPEVAALAREVLALREFAERVISPCEWGPTAFLTDNEEDIAEAAERLGLFRTVKHPQPCEVEGCECDGAPELLHFAWRHQPSPEGGHGG